MAVACVPEERRQWARRALEGQVRSIEFVRKPGEIAHTKAELVLVGHEEIACEDTVSEALANRDPLWIVIDAPVQARITWRGRGADLATPPDASTLEVGSQIEALLRRVAAEREKSPLTGLPGNRWLRRRLNEILNGGERISLVMADIDNFKMYNDLRGHLAGDRVIVALAEALREAVERHNGFLAHVGGDDFAVICAPAEAEELIRTAKESFRQRGRQVAGETEAGVTIVSTLVRPDEAEDLPQAFERLAALRLRQREQKSNGE